jgi:hypothetical protein
VFGFAINQITETNCSPYFFKIQFIVSLQTSLCQARINAYDKKWLYMPSINTKDTDNVNKSLADCNPDMLSKVFYFKCLSPLGRKNCRVNETMRCCSIEQVTPIQSSIYFGQWRYSLSFLQQEDYGY